MANTPIQYPNIDLPGAEYLALPPNRTVAIGGRRRALVASGTVTVPATSATAAFNTVTIENPMPQTAGIYVHLLFGTFAPSDNTGHLSITGFEFGFGSNPQNQGDIGIRLGIPTATTQFPLAETAIVTERDLLILMSDVIFTDGFGTALGLTQRIVVSNNDGAAAHNFSVQTWCLYSRLDGLLVGT